MNNLCFTFVCFLCVGCVLPALGQYEPTWKSLDARPLPKWYDEAKIGIFLHWGIYSVPSFGNEWFWKHWKDGEEKYVNFMEQNYRQDFTYQDFAADFTAEFFDPDQWAQLFSDSGAKYVVLTSKHHEGYTLWPSKYSFGWNSMDVGPARDIVGELASSVRTKTPGIHFGLYHSLLEWFNPILKEDEKNFFFTNNFATMKTMPELYELVNEYKPEIIWSDGDWDGTPEYWESKEFLAWLFNDSPVKETVVVNDRWGLGTNCRHGSYFTCSDNYNPGTLKPYKWERCVNMDRFSWGYRREATLSDYHTIEDLLRSLSETISLGGNFLLNAGPTRDGRIPPIMEERFRQMGKWLGVNGEAIYGSSPYVHQNDTVTVNVWYTQTNLENSRVVYCLVLDWPETDSLILGSVIPTPTTSITMLGHTGTLEFKEVAEGLQIDFPAMQTVSSEWIWVLKMENVNETLTPLTRGHFPV